MPLILPSQRVIRPNPLAYPAGATPGIDPSHPAAQGISDGQGISVVAIDGNFVDLATGRVGAKTGSSGTAVRSGIGRAVRILSNEYSDFTGYLANTPTAITMAGIVQFDALNSDYQIIITPDTSISGHGQFGLNASGQLIVFEGGDVFSLFSPALNTPYFLAVSVVNVAGSGTYNWVALNLRTGILYSRTEGILPPIFSLNGTYRIGNFNGTTHRVNGPLAATMYAPTYLSLSQLLQWAADPWAFWYPNKRTNLVNSTGAAATFLAAWARGSNLPVIGTGNY